MRPALFAALFVGLTALVLAQPPLDDDYVLPEQTFPDPLQTTNLWFELVTTGEVDAALALLSSHADRKSLRSMFEAFAERAKDVPAPPVAVAMKLKEDVAIVHFIDGRFSTGGLDVDPMFLVRETLWKVAPIFGGYEIPEKIQGSQRQET